MGGIVLGFIGTVLIASGEAGTAGFAFEPGAGYLLLAALTFSLGSVVQKPLLSRLPAVPVTAYYFVVATLGLAGFAPGLPANRRGAGVGELGTAVSDFVSRSAVVRALVLRAGAPTRGVGIEFAVSGAGVHVPDRLGLAG